MCRYAWHNYRDHFACFDCRKAFKQWQWEATDEQTFREHQRLKHVPRKIVCPDCSSPMADMGLDFKSPPKDDVEAWEIIRALHDHGFTFHNCGCGVGFKPPRTLRQVPQWLERHRKRGEGETLSRRFAGCRDLPAGRTDKSKQRVVWAPWRLDVALVGSTVVEVLTVKKHFRLSAPGMVPPHLAALDALAGDGIAPPDKLICAVIKLWVCLDHESLAVAEGIVAKNLVVRFFELNSFYEVFPGKCILVEGRSGSKARVRALSKLAQRIIAVWHKTSMVDVAAMESIASGSGAE